MATRVLFRVTADTNTQKAELLGDFTDWNDEPIIMNRIGPGIFEKWVKLEGNKVYYYKFKTDGEWKEVMNDYFPANGTVPNPYKSRDYFIKTNDYHDRRYKHYEETKLTEKDGCLIDLTAEQILLKCVKTEDYSEWNKYKEENHLIYLEGIDLSKKDLKGVDLSNVHLSRANLKKALLIESKLMNSFFLCADLEGCSFNRADMTQVQLKDANLINAKLNSANLTNAQSNYSYLNGAGIHNTEIYGADFSFSRVDSETLILTRKFDDHSLFNGVDLSSARIHQGLIGALNYNIRKFRWTEWYDKKNSFGHRLISCLGKIFWSFSDYGKSTTKVFKTFLISALIFASIYFISDILGFPLIDNFSHIECSAQAPEDTEVPLKMELSSNSQIELDLIQLVFRVIYFSVVTMTTLGFGDMYANPQSYLGHALLVFQVLLGYVLLGALITRLSILFTSGGPDVKPLNNVIH